MSSSFKIVIDTNVFVAALRSRNGASNQLLTWLFRQPEPINVVSNALILEIEAVLLRERNKQAYPHLSDTEIVAFVDDIALISHHQSINFLWRPCLHDADDDMVLETAFNASAQMIVTHNMKDFATVPSLFNIRICTPAMLLHDILSDPTQEVSL